MRHSTAMLAFASLFTTAACQDTDTVAAPDVSVPGIAYALDAGTYCDGATMPAAECEVLIDVYNATGGDSWDQPTDDWGDDPNPCEWWGVVCENGDHGSVIELNLIQDNLTGTIPPEIGQLSSLSHLRLGANELGGPLPEELANLQNLELLEITVNHHTGPVPAWLANLPNLRYFFAFGNDFSGPIPAELGNAPALEYVVLSQNQLSGAIPEELAGLSGLIEFHASYNAFSGVLPLEFAALGESMVSCVVFSNDGDLSIPDTEEYRALDANGDEEICSLPFSSAEDVGEDAVGGIEELVPDPLNEGVANALTTKIENAMAKAANGQYQAAINQMMAFIGQLGDMVANGVLTQDQADPFLQQAQALIALWTAEL